MAFLFDHPHSLSHDELVEVLGGKGAGLAEMTALGVPVPPGFTIPVSVCRSYRRDGWPADLHDQIDAAMAQLELRMGRRFGDPRDPLLVAVRSGAPRSMPGMLDTVLNLGMNAETVAGLALVSGDPLFAWDAYRRFVEMYATTVMGVDASAVRVTRGEEATDPGVRDLLRRVEELAGRSVPDDPRRQLAEAVRAVFHSWDSARARTYRAKEQIDEDMGTAVTVQAMVFGNRGPRSGTGVVFTRNPSTGEDVAYGDYLPRAQGEEVVSGRAKTLTIAEMTDHLPECHAELMRLLQLLEQHCRDMCDVEFTVDDGRLWILQTRVAKRGAVAAVRVAVDLVHDPRIRLTYAEALTRASETVRARARAEILERPVPVAELRLVGKGLGASPGVASGAVVLSSDAALDAAEGDLILVRPETSPEDVAGMSVATGILTCTGGLVSHAAVVARGWGIPAVVGAEHLRVTPEGIYDRGGREVAREGTEITIDGATGEVWIGREEAKVETPPADTLARHLPELLTLESWSAPSAASAAERGPRVAVTPRDQDGPF